MRAPAFGAPATDLYAAAIDMSAWAERHGGVAAVLCEHHGSEDGYLPAPLILGAAIAARTERLALSLVVIVAFHDPVRLAEDMALLDVISRRRAIYVLGLGYRPEEFEHFGLDAAQRGRLADDKVELLRQLLTGRPVSHHGRHIVVSPPPRTPGGPVLMWGGASLAAARRAGRYGLGLLANGSTSCTRRNSPRRWPSEPVAALWRAATGDGVALPQPGRGERAARRRPVTAAVSRGGAGSRAGSPGRVRRRWPPAKVADRPRRWSAVPPCRPPWPPPSGQADRADWTAGREVACPPR